MQLMTLCEHPSIKWVPSKKAFFIMKLTACILLFCCLTAAATGVGQTVSLKVTNVPVKKVLREIIKQTRFTILYSEESLKDAKPVSINVDNAPIEQVLTLCFKDQPFT